MISFSLKTDQVIYSDINHNLIACGKDKRGIDGKGIK